MLAVGEQYLEDVKRDCPWVEAATRMATGFSGGFGNTREELCGALSGGVMIIGALYGRTSKDEDDQPAIDLVVRFRERFLEAFGYTQCSALREEIIDTPGGYDSCGELVERAARILLELLEEMR